MGWVWAFSHNAQRCLHRLAGGFAERRIMEKIKVLIVDDNSQFLRAAMLTLSTLPYIHVVGTARSGANALALAQLKKPDLILMDVNMPEMDGIQTAARMRSEGVAAKLALVSFDESVQARVRESGVAVDAFITKTEFAAEAHTAMHKLFAARLPAVCGA